MRASIPQLLLASLATLNLANGLPQDPANGDVTQDGIPYGTPVPVFADKFEDLSIWADPISVAGAGIVVNMTLEEGLNITDSVVNVAFYNTEAHVELSLAVQGGGKAFLPIWSSSGFSPTSSGFSFELGLALDIDADIDLRAGFDVAIPDGTYFNYIPSSGLEDTNLVPGEDLFQIIPLHVESGSATFKAALQARVAFGLDLDTPLIDANGEVGAYINLPELVYDVYGTDTCGLEVTSFADIGFGIWAKGDVSVGWDDDEVADEGDGITLPFTPFIIGETATDCLVGQPTSFLVGGAEPITVEPSVTPTTFKVSGAPPPTLSATPTTVKPSNEVPGTVEAGHPEMTVSASVPYTTSTVYTTMVHTVVSCAVSVTNCPAKSVQTLVVTDTVKLYTTVCPVSDAEDVSTVTISAPADTPGKIESSSTTVSQLPVLGEAGGKSNATETVSTHGSYQTPNSPTVVPVTAAALGYKDMYGFGGFMAIVWCVLAL
ncbi:extracellular serine-threonine rich [Fusarium longipes]|uniref:Extracellular serine-threonine rich n=1 Tax=Fusarium longipes TaxID=694270 RepID=A0A395SAS6_9HYPO|nr:extracellular serine-threonine rich [Fusarium longipes]